MTSRAGTTEKLSVSLSHEDAVALRRRARRLHGNNLSAAVAEGVRRLREEEGREALAAWLAEADDMSPADEEAVRAEWRAPARTPKRRARK